MRRIVTDLIRVYPLYPRHPRSILSENLAALLMESRPVQYVFGLDYDLNREAHYVEHPSNTR
jgi:hypothetical protein